MTLLKNDFFTIHELGDGIYAAIENSNKIAGCNSGIIDFGSFSLIFDTFLNLDAALSLSDICFELTGKKPGFLVNSHDHIDHFHGNQVFSDSTVIIASKGCDSSIQKQKDEFKARKIYHQSELEEQWKKITRQDGIEKMNNVNSYLFNTNLCNPDSFIRTPSSIFEKELKLIGNKRNGILINVENCHSRDDTILVLDNDKVVFMGDTIFVKEHPWLGSGNPKKLLQFLKNIINKKYKYYVPGHGGLGTSQDVQDQIQYIEIIIDHLEHKKIDKNCKLNLEDLPNKFREWNPLCFQWNLDSIKL